MRVHLNVQTVTLGLILGLAIDLQASLAQRLPPPPNVPVLPTPSAPLPSVNPAPIVPRQPVDGIPAPNERIYTAPQVNPVQPASRGFRVFVDSDSSYVLQQVRLIQPDAFLQNFQGRRVIQAGLFSDEFKARQQVSRLSAQGIAAEVTTRSPQPGSENAQVGYYAIVPGSQRDVQDARDRVIQLGVAQSAVQVRDRPRGLHLAVGPFSNQRDAERMVRFLRNQGSLDARLFYDR